MRYYQSVKSISLAVVIALLHGGFLALPRSNEIKTQRDLHGMQALAKKN